MVGCMRYTKYCINGKGKVISNEKYLISPWLASYLFSDIIHQGLKGSQDMKLLSILVIFGAGILAATSSLVDDNDGRITQGATGLRTRDLLRRTNGNRAASMITSHPVGSLTSFGSDSSPTQSEGQASPRQGSPTLGRGSQSPRSRFLSSAPSRQAADSSRSLAGLSIEPGPSTPQPGRLKPQSPPTSRRPYKPINSGSIFYDMRRDIVPRLRPGEPKKPMPHAKLQIENDAKSRAKQAIIVANQRHQQAKQVSDARRADSPTTKTAVKDYFDATNKAITATEEAAHVQYQTIRDVWGTGAHDTINKRLTSGSRKGLRVLGMREHMQAFKAEQKARSSMETTLQRNPPQHEALLSTSLHQQDARWAADRFYRTREQYLDFKAQHSDGSSSSEDDRDLRDNPKTWRHTNQGQG